MPEAALDTRPLTDPVDHAAVAAYAKELGTRGVLASNVGGIVGVVVVIVAFALVTLSIGSASLISVSNGGGFGAVSPVVVLPVLVIGGIVAWKLSSGHVARIRRWRLGRFAAANGMEYWPRASSPALPGMIFSLGSERLATDVLRATRPRQIDYANYEYTTGSGKNRTTHRWGYVAVRLDVPLPNIVLDATSNNTILGSNLPASFDRHQRLHLEGDFDRHFALYCPEGYEQDALYLFTPDIMARFIDSASALDVEIVDDWLFLYSRRSFATLDPATWVWITSVVAAFQDKFAQWSRWRDDRLAATSSSPVAAVGGRIGPTPLAPGSADAAAPGSAQLLRPPPGVATAGRRLKRGIRWSTVVTGAVFIGIWIAIQYLRTH